MNGGVKLAVSGHKVWKFKHGEIPPPSEIRAKHGSADASHCASSTPCFNAAILTRFEFAAKAQGAPPFPKDLIRSLSVQ